MVNTEAVSKLHAQKTSPRYSVCSENLFQRSFHQMEECLWLGNADVLGHLERQCTEDMYLYLSVCVYLSVYAVCVCMYVYVLFCRG